MPSEIKSTAATPASVSFLPRPCRSPPIERGSRAIGAGCDHSGLSSSEPPARSGWAGWWVLVWPWTDLSSAIDASRIAWSDRTRGSPHSVRAGLRELRDPARSPLRSPLCELRSLRGLPPVRAFRCSGDPKSPVALSLYRLTALRAVQTCGDPLASLRKSAPAERASETSEKSDDR